MNFALPAALAVLSSAALAADTLTTRNPNASAPAARIATALDPAKDLPRYPAVEPRDAVATWKNPSPGKSSFLSVNSPSHCWSPRWRSPWRPPTL